MGAVRLDLAPLVNDPEDLGVEDGARIWRARSLDPAFVAKASSPLAPGWYRARVDIHCRSGDVNAPRLYIPDAAGRFAEERSVAMQREDAAFVADFQLPHAADRIRFDPSRFPCEFSCNGMEVEPVLARAPMAHEAPAQPGALMRLFRRGLRRLPVRPLPGPARPATRKARALEAIDRKGVGIEIGPSHDPLAPKAEGFNVHIIDHASREELLKKYEGHPVTHERIEEVDYVWRGETYLALTGHPKHYDWIIASHLIEHTPDLIGFLQDCDAILKDGGVLSLVIPDKRYIFDRFRPITGLARIVDSHVSPNRVHSAGAVAEHFMNVASKSHLLGWSEGTGGDYVFIHSAHEARQKVREALEEGNYEDVHNWCFVPHSFRLLMNDLYVLGYTKLREVRFHATEGCEFYVTLGRHGDGPPLSRLEILRAVDRELASPDA